MPPANDLEQAATIRCALSIVKLIPWSHGCTTLMFRSCLFFSDLYSRGTPCTRLPFSAFLAALLLIGVIHYNTAVFCERRPYSPLDVLNMSTVTIDGGALEPMSKTEGEAQLSIQRSAVDKNDRVLMHKIVNRRGK